MWENLKLSFSHPRHWPLQVYAFLSCLVPTFGLESHFVKVFPHDTKITVSNRDIFITYIAAGIGILLVVQFVLWSFTERTTRKLFVLGFFISTLVANALVYTATHMEDIQQPLFFAALITLNLANCIILIVLVSSFHFASPSRSGCFSINLINSVYSLAVILSRILLEVEDYFTGGAIDQLDFQKFQGAALLNLVATLVFAFLLLFKVRL